VCDLLEARPSAERTAGQGVPEDVGTLGRRRDFRASQRPNHGGGDDGTREGVAAVTPEVLHEHAALAGPRALAAKVVDDRAARVARKRENRSAARLARPEVEIAATPVDVAKAHPGALAGPKPQGREAVPDRAVREPTRLAEIARGNTH